MAVVPLTRVDLVLGDFPGRMRKYADWIDRTVRYGTDTAEQLRGDAAILDSLVVAIVHRLSGAP